MLTDIKIADYNYLLPDDLVAQHPIAERDNSKLLLYKSGNISETIFHNVLDNLNVDSLLVFNNTKVIHARLFFYKSTGAKIEIFCLEPNLPADYAQNFASTTSCVWACLVGNLKKWKGETLTTHFFINNVEYELVAEHLGKSNEAQLIQFRWYTLGTKDGEITFAQILENIGVIPIPPYINRESDEDDLVRYQTIYSKEQGSVAAPTAGLHFTPDIINGLQTKNIQKVELTLHVGAGTFRPVKSEKIVDHEMHTEHFFVSKQALQTITTNLGRIVAVGTTSVRMLESLYWLGVKVITEANGYNSLKQWEAYQLPNNIPVSDSLEALLDYLHATSCTIFEASTQILIAPPYTFRVVSSVITNFHLPKSTLLLLVAAFIGSDWKKVYDYALSHNFRFLSYGDSSLLIP